MTPEILIGISACLMGQEVRFDGGHKHDRFLTRTVGEFVRYVPVCPEVDIGLGTPRESLRLIRLEGDIRLIAPRSGADHTETMRSYARSKVEDLKQLDLSGFILKRGSPSCGMERVRVYHKDMPEKTGSGIFARELLDGWPRLPVEEEGRLNDPALRENFFARVFAYRRLRSLFESQWSVGELVAFHTREKLFLLAHRPEGYRSLGRLVAEAGKHKPEEVAELYQNEFMASLEDRATRGRHVNVLQHIMGYFKTALDSPVRQKIEQVVNDFAQGLLPLIVPVTLLQHYVDLLGIGYLQGQTYLQPHPKELMLRNHA